MSARSVPTVYRLASLSGWARSRRRRSDGAVVFCFHNVVPRDIAGGVGEASLHLDRESFEQLVHWMTGAYTVVPLLEISTRAARRRSLAGLAAITFDDAYLGVFLHALPVLAKMGAPATVFVVTRAAGTSDFFWWDLLADGGALSESLRRRGLDMHRGDGETIAKVSPRRAGQPLPRVLSAADWETVRAGMSELLVVGSHTRTHRNLAALEGADVQRELRASREEIAERLNTEPALVSYPYGLHTPAVVREAERAGYLGGVTMRHGLAEATGFPLVLPRVNVPAGISVEALECWAAGLRFRRGG